MHIIISNYSRNSLALIRWAEKRALEDVTICYIDTGWSADGWLEYVAATEEILRRRGFGIRHLKSRVTFQGLVDIKRGFPSREHQWCSLHLKGITLLQWLDEADPECGATLLMAGRNSEGLSRRRIAEFVEESEYHGGRRVWQPLYDLDDAQRDRLLAELEGITPPARVGECAPCINSSPAELCRLSEAEIRRVEELEEELGVAMFGSSGELDENGIRAIIRRARQSAPGDERRPFRYGCSAEFGCGS